ncbi:hypothetical protein KSS87_015485 [Heliosperma pusillum]|nr:hypothetical protein KSS87_015485 [Heliosperma pusillum]
MSDQLQHPPLSHVPPSTPITAATAATTAAATATTAATTATTAATTATTAAATATTAEATATTDAPPSTPLSDSKKSAPEPDTVAVPTYSSWFTWNGIHEVEYKNMTEFFDSKSPSKNPTIYKYYRNAIVKKFRLNSSRKLTFTEVRRIIVGDVGSIRRVFDFLEAWGLVNYSPPPASSKQHHKSEDKEGKSISAANAAANAAVGGDGGVMEANVNSNQKARKWCSGCMAVCTIACFVCDKYDLVLCARCYVRGNYKVGVSSTEFRRVEISEPAKSEWTDKETLQLLEAIMHYGDDWKRVAEHVAGRSEKDCVARFIKLPFGEQFVEPAYLNPEDSLACQIKGHTDTECGAEPDAKKMRLTPLADASNPIMAQAAFLSALAGVEVSEAAAQAAVATLYDMGHLTSRVSGQSQALPITEQGNSSYHSSEEAHIVAERQLKQEEDEFLKSISTITDVKMKGIIDKIGRLEEMDCQLEREWKEWHQMKHQLFLDKLSLLFHKAAVPKAPEIATEENVRKELTTSS